MNPRSKFRLIITEDESKVEIEWFNFNPGDLAESVISTNVLQSVNQDLSTIVVEQGQVIYIRYWADTKLGISISMDAILDDFYKIGLDTYNWSNYITNYHEAKPKDWDELDHLLQQDYDDHDIEKIPKEIHREWFEIALNSGEFHIKRGTWDYHFNIANVFGFFPWIIYFGNGGKITDTEFTFNVKINADFEIDMDAIFDHIDGQLDEQFWVLIYQFVLQLDSISEESRGDTWFRFLQAVHEFTTHSDDYVKKLEHMFNYKDLLPIFDVSFLSNYVQGLLLNIADEESSPAICKILLEFSTFLLQFDFVELAKLTEATTLEHALNLENGDKKAATILELTRRSSTWGNDHLISFIQSLIGLLPGDEEGSALLSDVINEVIEQLRQTWDGLLCVVDSKIIAGRIGEAIEIRFDATNRIGDRQTKSGDIFSALVWSLDYKYSPNERHDIAMPYMDEASEHLHSTSLIDQYDIVIQTCMALRDLEYLHIFLQYLRNQLYRFSDRYLQTLLERIGDLLDSAPSSPMIAIEYLLLQLYTLQHVSVPVDPDRPFQVVSEIYNSINPALSGSEESLKYISDAIIHFALNTMRWSLIEETRQRYLLLANDRESATGHLKNIFFNNSKIRAKLPADKLTQDDIGIKLFQEALELADIGTDYLLITSLLPDIKKMAIKSRSYHALSELLLTEIRFKLLQSLDWIPEFEDDISFLLKRGELSDVARVFVELLRMDLSDQERSRLLAFQLELTDGEPDLLTSDEIYDMRQELAQLSGDDSMQQEFMIENYQRGVSELLSKGDTSNLTNLLMDAIKYSQTNDPIVAEEFKEILMDSFENITQEFESQTQSNVYLYLLTVWRRIMDTFASSDFTMILRSTNKLLRLNSQLFSKSGNNQYLRRCQLVLKEMSLVAYQHTVTLSEEQLESFIPIFDKLLEMLVKDQEDFGIFAAVFQSAMFFHRVGHSMSFLPILDQAINGVKQTILIDSDAQSSIFLLLLLLSELNFTLDGDLHNELQIELITRVKRVINFSQSLDLETEISKKIKELRQTINSSDPTAFFYEFPFTLGQYLSNYSLWN